MRWIQERAENHQNWQRKNGDRDVSGKTCSLDLVFGMVPKGGDNIWFHLLCLNFWCILRLGWNPCFPQQAGNFSPCCGLASCLEMKFSSEPLSWLTQTMWYLVLGFTGVLQCGTSIQHSELIWPKELCVSTQRGMYHCLLIMKKIARGSSIVAQAVLM